MIAWRRRVPAPAVLLALWVVVVVVVDVAWLARYRAHVVPEYDEAGYMAMALRDLHGWQDHGVRGLATAFVAGAPSAPIVPLVTVVPYLLFGAGISISVVTQLGAVVLLAVATYGLGRRVVPAPWAALAAGLVVAFPVTSDFSRIFHFAVPTAALFTCAAWAVAASDGMRRLLPSVVAGVALGLAVLTRTMTVAYVPGLGAAALVLCLRDGDRRRRLRSLLVLVGATVLVTAAWLVPRGNYRAVRHYLVGAGYGERSVEYGAAHSPASVAYWLKQAKVVTGELQLPLALALAACVVSGLLVMPRTRAGVRRIAREWSASALVVPTVIVVEGYLALTTSRNVGTAFSLPWLPSLAVLCVYAASRSPHAARVVLATALCAASVFAVVVKSDAIGVAAARRTVHLPVMGTVTVTDGNWVARGDLEGAGYPLPPPDRRVPPLHSKWMPFMESEMSSVVAFADRHRLDLGLTVATGDVVLSTTRFALAAELAQRRHVTVERFSPRPTREYRRSLRDGGHDLLVTSDPPPSGGDIDARAVCVAADAAGYRIFRTSRAPDGRRIVWWWRDGRPDPA